MSKEFNIKEHFESNSYKWQQLAKAYEENNVKIQELNQNKLKLEFELTAIQAVLNELKPYLPEEPVEVAAEPVEPAS
jgi:hypothetical protein